jgi:hypothetical protein
MTKAKKKTPPPIKCPECDQEAGEEIECPECGKLKRECCGIAGRNVSCFECEEK